MRFIILYGHAQRIPNGSQSRSSISDADLLGSFKLGTNKLTITRKRHCKDQICILLLFLKKKNTMCSLTFVSFNISVTFYRKDSSIMRKLFPYWSLTCVILSKSWNFGEQYGLQTNTDSSRRYLLKFVNTYKHLSSLQI